MTTTINNYTELRITQLQPMLELAFLEKANLFLLGDPGVGKTEVIGAFAASLKNIFGTEARFTTLVASMLDRLDLAGLPFRTEKNTTDFALMKEIADATQELNPDGAPTVIYINEVNAAPDSVQPALLRLLNERAISGYRLRDNVMLIADGNHAASSRIARDMPEPSKRRFIWLHVRVDKNDWLNYASMDGTDARVCAFIETHPACLCDFSSVSGGNQAQRGRVTYSCPASWTKLGKSLAGILRLPDETMKAAWIDGQVGVASGRQFSAFIAHSDKLPNLDELLKSALDGKKISYPDEIDTRYLLLGMIANRVRETKAQKDVDGGLAVVKSLIESQKGEDALFLFRSTFASTEMKKLMEGSKKQKEVLEAFMARPELMKAVIAAFSEKK